MAQAVSAAGSPKGRSVFEPFLRRFGVCLLDGGLTTALPNGAEKHFLWGHQLLYGLDGGLEALKKTHRQYLDAGAHVIGTLSYKLSLELLVECRNRGMLQQVLKDAFADPASTADLAPHAQLLFSRSVAAAREARDEFVAARSAAGGNTKADPKPLVFASTARECELRVGPCKDSTQLFVGATDPATRSDGAEQEARLENYYRVKLNMLKNAGADGFSIETLAGSREATIAARVSGEILLPTLISFCCQDAELTLSGEKLADCVRELLPFDHVEAIGVNCVNPELAPELVRQVKSSVGETRMVAIYPNSGEVWDASEGKRCWHGDGMKVLDGTDAVGFKEAGADLIGGCCRVSPAQIQKFQAALCCA